MTTQTIFDPRRRQYVFPARIVWRSGGVSAIRDSENLLAPDRRACILKHDGEPPGLLLDFGRELHGGIQLENGMAPGHCPIRVRVRFGESVSEAMGTPNNDHAIHDTVCEIPWYGSTEIGNTGFRFVRIDLIDPGAELHLIQARAVFLFRNLEFQGAFSCSDERLNRIWQTGAHTVHLCMQGLLWDGIKRDRLVWIGDMHPETMVINHVFGEVDIVPHSLDFVRDQTPLPGWMNGISSYSLWWIIIQQDWFLHHGDLGYLEEQRYYLVRLLDVLFGQIGKDHSEQLGAHRFLDWPSSEDAAAVHAGLHALLSIAFTAGAELCGVLGETERQTRCLAAAGQLRLYTPAPTRSKQANALAVLAGQADAAATNREVLGAEPLKGLSTFYGYYVLQARALAGDYQGCLEVIRTYWGAMLDLGATTFWEDFDLTWTEDAGRIDELTPAGKKDVHAEYGNYCYKGLRHSLCHGWASGPTAWLSEHVLGFKPLKAGSRVLRVAPHLGDLDWAEGAFPTRYGALRVRHEKTAAGLVETRWTGPDEVQIVLDGCRSKKADERV